MSSRYDPSSTSAGCVWTTSGEAIGTSAPLQMEMSRRLSGRGRRLKHRRPHIPLDVQANLQLQLVGSDLHIGAAVIPMRELESFCSTFHVHNFESGSWSGEDEH